MYRVRRRRAAGRMEWCQFGRPAFLAAEQAQIGCRAAFGPATKRKAAKRAMNRFERLFGFRGEAKVKFLDGEFQVVSPGDYVLCAVTGEPIPLAELKYWSVALQEAYATAEASLTRILETRRPSEG
jgi:hypothetical protein